MKMATKKGGKKGVRFSGGKGGGGGLAGRPMGSKAEGVEYGGGGKGGGGFAGR